MTNDKQIDGIPVYRTPIPLKCYTYVGYSHGKLFIRGIDNDGNRVMFYSDYQPIVWVPLQFNYNEYKQDIVDVEFNKWHMLIDNVPLVGLRFKSIYACNQFVRKNTKVTRNQFGAYVKETKVHTSPSNMYVSQYIAENFPGQLHLSSKDLRILTYDIETEIGHRDVRDDSIVMIKHNETNETRSVTIAMFEDIFNDGHWKLQNGNQWVEYDEHPYAFKGNFPDPMEANERITLITVKDINNNRIDTWGYEDFVNNRQDVVYHQCKDEPELLQSFVDFIQSDYPDAASGWNTSVFDNTYVANRIKRVLGEETMKLLSPIREVNFKQVDHNEYGKAIIETSWLGVADLDYLRLYKKFTYGGRESYKLDAIAESEIKIKKIENPTGGNFKDFYSGKFDIRSKPTESDNDIRKLGFIRTQMRKAVRQDETLMEKFRKLDDKIVKMCKQLFIEYNIRDVELVDKIDKKQHFLDLIMTIAYLAKCNYENVFSPVQTWDYTIYNALLKDNIVIPIKKGGEKTEKFPGAYVKAPLIGKHEYCESSRGL